MRNLTAFQRNTVVVGVRELMNKDWFSICEFNDLIKAVDGYISQDDYDALRRLHCVRWCNMPHELRQQVRELIYRSLRIEELQDAVRPQARAVQQPQHIYQVPAVFAGDPIRVSEVEGGVMRRKWAALKRVWRA